MARAAGSAKQGAGPDGERRNREAAVIKAAIDVFYERGYPDTSVQDVADRVGVLKGSLYHYIRSKEDLLFKILNDSHAQGSAIIERARALEGSPLERLRAYLVEYLTWYLRNIKRVSVYFSEWRFLTGERLETVGRQRKEYDDFVRGLIVEAQEAGEIDEWVEPRMATFYVLGAVNGVSTWYRPRGRRSPESVAEIFAEHSLRALTPRAPTDV